MIKKIVLILLMVIPLTGCLDNQQIGDTVLVSGLGVDKDGGGYSVTAELVKMSSELGKGGMEAVLITASDVTINGALKDIAKKAAGNLHFNHCQTVVIGEDAASDGIGFAVDLILLNSKFHISSEIVIAHNAAARDILSLKPQNQSAMAYEISEMLSTAQKETQKPMKVPAIDLNDCIGDPHRHAVFPVVAKNGEEVQLDGIAYFHGDKLAGFLDEENAKYVAFITDDIRGGNLSKSSADGKYTGANILSNKTSVSPKLDNGRITVTIKTKTLLSLVEPQTQDTNFKELEDGFENVLTSKINGVIAEADCDLFGFSTAFRNKYPEEWSKIRDWDAEFRNINIVVDTDVTIKDSSFLT